MAVINDNGPEESRDTGATYIIPSHQSTRLCGLLCAQPAHCAKTNAHKHTHTKTPHLLSVSKPPRRFSLFTGLVADTRELQNDTWNKINE